MKHVLASALLVGACHRSAPPPPTATRAPLTADHAAGDELVASVDGRPIYASDVALQARAAGTSARAALDELVRAELLVGEAARRGLDRARDVLEAGQQAMVRRALAEGFEKEVGPAEIPRKAVVNAYSRNSGVLDHDWYVDVWHIVVQLPRNPTADERAAARKVADELARRAHGVADAAAFQALASTVAPLPSRVERVVTGLNDWTVPEFAQAAFKLEHPGDTSPPIETKYGFHIIYLVGRIPPKHVPLAEVEPTLRQGLFPEFQKREFLRRTDALLATHQVSVHPERLPQ
jgi:hypothetical protein